MLENKSQLIAYIGNKPVKKDTAGGTATIWNGFGDVQEVLHGPAVKLLQHPEVWITKKVFDQKYAPQTDSSVQSVTGYSVGLSSATIPVPAVIAPAVIGETPPAPPAQVAPAAPETPDAKPDELNAGGSTDKASAIQAAILSLEPGNPEHFSESTGAPLLNAVRAAANDDSIVVKDLNAAWKTIANKSK